MQADRYYAFNISAPADAGAGTTTPLHIDSGIMWQVRFTCPPTTLTGMKLTYANQVVLPYNETTQIGRSAAALELIYDVVDMPTGGQWGVISYNADTIPHMWVVVFTVQNLAKGRAPDVAPVQHLPVTPMDIHAAAGQLGLNETRR